MTCIKLQRVSALVCYLPRPKDEHVNAVFPGTWRPPLFVCLCMPVSRNICSVKLLAVVRSLVNLYDHLINRVYFFYGKKHFTFLEGKWMGFRAPDFCVIWGSMCSGGTRKGEEMIQPVLLLVFIIVLTLQQAMDRRITSEVPFIFFHKIRKSKVSYFFICPETFLYNMQRYVGFYSHHLLFPYVPLGYQEKQAG